MGGSPRSIKRRTKLGHPKKFIPDTARIVTNHRTSLTRWVPSFPWCHGLRRRTPKKTPRTELPDPTTSLPRYKVHRLIIPVLMETAIPAVIQSRKNNLVVDLYMEMPCECFSHNRKARGNFHSLN